jgi:hypothetical protein
MEKEKAVYAPGELKQVRNRLGPIDENEARRMAELLGGEVGVERAVTDENSSARASQKSGGKGKGGGSQPMRRVETAAEAEAQSPPKKTVPKKKLDPEDDPAVPFQVSYWERVKMARYAAQPRFEIKSMLQIIDAICSFFRKDVDLVSGSFVIKRMDEYYKKIEVLVVSTRTMFPRNNIKNNEQLKKMSPFMYSILNTIRYWNIERITSDIAKMQSRPRHVKVASFAEILRAVYKPLFILERLDFEVHIKGAYKLLYKLLYIENPVEAKGKYQELIRSALVAYETITKDIHYLLYPLLMKLLSNKWLPYQRFFLERRNRIMAFLNVTEEECLSPENMFQKDTPEEASGEQPQEESAPENQVEPESSEAAAKRVANETERKALERGLRTLESLFPQAGWDRLDTYPDLYSYFAKVLNLKKGYELIAPTDPLLQVSILMQILEELFFGLRYVSFGTIEGADPSEGSDGNFLEKIIDEWHDYELTFTQEYLNRLIEYCQLLESSAESRTSNYAQRLYTELQWIKRLCFLPHYQFDSIGGSPIKKSKIPPLYPEIRRARKYLTVIATSIEEGNKQGGAEKQVSCEGINNPWASYNFQIANPLSMRLNTLLGSNKRNNASLVFFTLSVVTVLDYLVNNEESWAYQNHSTPLFRSINGEGVIPQFGVDEKIDADLLFKQVMKTRQKEKKEGLPLPSLNTEGAVN